MRQTNGQVRADARQHPAYAHLQTGAVFHETEAQRLAGAGDRDGQLNAERMAELYRAALRPFEGPMEAEAFEGGPDLER